MLSLIFRVTVLFGAGFIALWIARKLSAAARHGLCLCTMLAALLLPTTALVRTPSFAFRVPAAVGLMTTVGQTGRAPSRRMSEGIEALWAAGALLTWMWVAAGYWRVGRIRARARTIGANIMAADIGVPAAVGLVSPAVLVPRDFESWRDTLRDAALRHERAHIDRKDLWAILAANVVCALYWFHPLAWMLRSRLRGEQELACDEAVVGGGFDAAEYAQSLLTVARRSIDGLAAGCAMTSRSDVTTRIRSVLTVGLRPHSCWARAAGGAAFLIIAGAALAPIQADTVYRTGDGVSAPRVLQRVQPQYTEEAKDARITGSVMLTVVIRPDGMAHDISVVQSLDPGLDRNAAEAVEKWHFQPGLKDGEPVAVRATILINYRLE